MPQFLAFLALAIGLPLAIALTGLSTWAWVGLGAAAWAVALVIKISAGTVVSVASERFLRRPAMKAAVWGLWSGLAELGVAAILFLTVEPFPALGDTIGFGIGAGSVEVVFVLISAVASSSRGTSTEADSPGAGMDWSGVIERALTSVGHVSSRGLVWSGVQGWCMAPAVVVALTTFGLVDGVATYGTNAKWDWHDPSVIRRFHRFLALVTVLEAVAFGVSIVLV
ncbi:MAG: hypothetical protein CMJ83_07120 [Planctomycetes bacterium]|nr:hypothetical protein [Planctomycetota bacterium]